MSIYFDIIGIRKYVIKKVIYNIGNTIPWACYQQYIPILYFSCIQVYHLVNVFKTELKKKK